VLPVVVIRPQPGNAATVAAGRAMGLDARGFPLFDMAPVPWTVPRPSPYRALLAGSANVFRHGGAGLGALTDLAVHAVGAVTADAARAAGFAVAAIGEGGLQPMAAALPPGRYLRLAGEKRVPLALPNGVEVDDVVVYAAAGLPLPPALAEVLTGPALVLLHSGEAAAHFAAESARLGVERSAISLVCLAPRIGLMAGPGWQHIEIAETRCDHAVLALAAQMCEKVSPRGH